MMKRYRKEGLYGFNTVGARMTGTIIFYCDPEKKKYFSNKYLQLLRKNMRRRGKIAHSYETPKVYDWKSTHEGASYDFVQGDAREAMRKKFETALEAKKSDKVDQMSSLRRQENYEAYARVYGLSATDQEATLDSSWQCTNLKEDLTVRLTRLFNADPAELSDPEQEFQKELQANLEHNIGVLSDLSVADPEAVLDWLNGNNEEGTIVPFYLRRFNPDSSRDCDAISRLVDIVTTEEDDSCADKLKEVMAIMQQNLVRDYFEPVNGFANWILQREQQQIMDENLQLFRRMQANGDLQQQDVDNLLLLVTRAELNLYWKLTEADVIFIRDVMRKEDTHDEYQGLNKVQIKEARLSEIAGYMLEQGKDDDLAEMEDDCEQQYTELKAQEDQKNNVIVVPEPGTEENHRLADRAKSQLRLSGVFIEDLAGGMGKRFTGGAAVKGCYPALKLMGQSISFLEARLLDLATMQAEGYRPNYVVSVSHASEDAVRALLKINELLIDQNQLLVTMVRQRVGVVVKPYVDELMAWYDAQPQESPVKEAVRRKELERWQHGEEVTLMGKHIRLSSQAGNREIYESVGVAGRMNNLNPKGTIQGFEGIFNTMRVPDDERQVTVTAMSLPPEEINTRNKLHWEGYLLREYDESEADTELTPEQVQGEVIGRTAINFLLDFGLVMDINKIDDILEQGDNLEQVTQQIGQYLTDFLSDKCGIGFGDGGIDEIVLEVTEEDGEFYCDLSKINFMFNIDPIHGSRQVDVYQLTGTEPLELETEESLRAKGYVFDEKKLAKTNKDELREGLPLVKTVMIVEGRKALALFEHLRIQVDKDRLTRLIARANEDNKTKGQLQQEIADYFVKSLTDHGIDVEQDAEIIVKLSGKKGEFSCDLVNDIVVKFDRNLLGLYNGTNLTAFQEAEMGAAIEHFRENPEDVAYITTLPHLGPSPGGIATKDKFTGDIHFFEGTEIQGLTADFLGLSRHFATGTVYYNLNNCWQVFNFTEEAYLGSSEAERRTHIDQLEMPKIRAVRQLEETTPNGQKNNPIVQTEIAQTLISRFPWLSGKVKIIEGHRLGSQAFHDPKTIQHLLTSKDQNVEASLRIPYRTDMPDREAKVNYGQPQEYLERLLTDIHNRRYNRARMELENIINEINQDIAEAEAAGDSGYSAALSERKELILQKINHCIDYLNDSQGVGVGASLGIGIVINEQGIDENTEINVDLITPDGGTELRPIKPLLVVVHPKKNIYKINPEVTTDIGVLFQVLNYLEEFSFQEEDKQQCFSKVTGLDQAVDYKEQVVRIEKAFRSLFRARIEVHDYSADKLRAERLPELVSLIKVIDYLLREYSLDESTQTSSLRYMRKELDAMYERELQTVMRKMKIPVQKRILPQSILAQPDKDRTMTEAGQPYEEWQARELAEHLVNGMSLEILSGAITADIIRTAFEPIMRALMRMDIPQVARWTAIKRLTSSPDEGATLIKASFGIKDEKELRTRLNKYDNDVGALYNKQKVLMELIQAVELGRPIKLKVMQRRIKELQKYLETRMTKSAVKLDKECLFEDWQRDLFDNITMRLDYKKALLICRYKLRNIIEKLELDEEYCLGSYPSENIVFNDYYDSAAAARGENPRRAVDDFELMDPRVRMWNVVSRAYLAELLDTPPARNIITEFYPELRELKGNPAQQAVYAERLAVKVQELQDVVYSQNFQLRKDTVEMFNQGAHYKGVIVTMHQVLENMLGTYEYNNGGDEVAEFFKIFMEQANPALELVRFKDSQYDFFSISCDELGLASEFLSELDNWHAALIRDEKFFKYGITGRVIRDVNADKDQLDKWDFDRNLFQRSGAGYINIAINNKISLISGKKNMAYSAGAVVFTIGDSPGDVGNPAEVVPDVLSLPVYLMEPWNRFLSAAEINAFKLAQVMQVTYIGRYHPETARMMEKGQSSFYPMVSALMQAATGSMRLGDREDLTRVEIAELDQMATGMRIATPLAHHVLDPPLAVLEKDVKYPQPELAFAAFAVGQVDVQETKDKIKDKFEAGDVVQYTLDSDGRLLKGTLSQGSDSDGIVVDSDGNAVFDKEQVSADHSLYDLLKTSLMLLRVREEADVALVFLEGENVLNFEGLDELQFAKRSRLDSLHHIDRRQITLPGNMLYLLHCIENPELAMAYITLYESIRSERMDAPVSDIMRAVDVELREQGRQEPERSAMRRAFLELLQLSGALDHIARQIVTGNPEIPGVVSENLRLNLDQDGALTVKGTATEQLVFSLDSKEVAKGIRVAGEKLTYWDVLRNRLGRDGDTQSELIYKGTDLVGVRNILIQTLLRRQAIQKEQEQVEVDSDESKVNIVIAVGGTNMVTSLSGSKGGPLANEPVATGQTPATRKALLQMLAEQIRAALEQVAAMDRVVNGIDIIWAGPGNYAEGRVMAPNIPGLCAAKLVADYGAGIITAGGFPLVTAIKAKMSDLVSVDVSVIHDGAANGRGEALLQTGSVLEPTYRVGAVNNAVGEVGHHIVSDKVVRLQNGMLAYEYNYQPPADGSFCKVANNQGQYYIEQLLSGPAITKRYIDLIVQKKGDGLLKFLQEVDSQGKLASEEWTMEQLEQLVQYVGRDSDYPGIKVSGESPADLERNINMDAYIKAQIIYYKYYQGDPLTIQFVNQLARELGQCLGLLHGAYPRGYIISLILGTGIGAGFIQYPQEERDRETQIVLIEGVGENFMLPRDQGEDNFMKLVCHAAGLDSSVVRRSPYNKVRNQYASMPTESLQRDRIGALAQANLDNLASIVQSNDQISQRLCIGSSLLLDIKKTLGNNRYEYSQKATGIRYILDKIKHGFDIEIINEQAEGITNTDLQIMLGQIFGLSSNDVNVLSTEELFARVGDGSGDVKRLLLVSDKTARDYDGVAAVRLIGSDGVSLNNLIAIGVYKYFGREAYEIRGLLVSLGYSEELAQEIIDNGVFVIPPARSLMAVYNSMAAFDRLFDASA